MWTGTVVLLRSRWIAFTRVHNMDDFSDHELVDRCYIAADFFSTYVVDHDVVKAMDDTDAVKVAIDAAMDALSAAYQAAGGAYIR